MNRLLGRKQYFDVLKGNASNGGIHNVGEKVLIMVLRFLQKLEFVIFEATIGGKARLLQYSVFSTEALTQYTTTFNFLTSILRRDC